MSHKPSLGLIMWRVKDAQASEIVDTLCGHMLNEKKDELREISNIGLHTVIVQLPTEPVNIPNLIVKRLTPRLITGVTTVLPIPAYAFLCCIF
jgi:hypothetical protein